MAWKCEICGKKPVSGNKVSHSNRKTRTRWMPNLQTVKVQIKKGLVRRIRVCTACLRSNKVLKAA